MYDLHHEPGRLGVGAIAPSSMQLLHIAAHLDTIERTILPALRAGTTIILDRFWWSTKVYGLASGVNRKTLDSMITVELAAWGSIKPTRLFLVTRSSPLRPEPEELWNKWKALYDDLATEERRSIPLSVIENESSVEAALADILAELEPVAGQPLASSGPQLGLEFPAEQIAERAP